MRENGNLTQQTPSTAIEGVHLKNIKNITKMKPAIRKIDTVRNLFESHKEQFEAALPKHLKAEHFLRVALTCISKNPALLECSQSSLMGSLLTSAQLGLSPDGILGEAYLIPFNNNKKDKAGNWQTVKEVQFIPGYRGLIQLAQRSGMVKSFQAREVYENDLFEYSFGLEPTLNHVPFKKVSGGPTHRGQLEYVYAVAHLTNGGSVFEVMNMDEVNSIRMISKSPNSPAWNNFYPEMAKKSVIRKLSKMLPLSPEFNKAINLDETAEFIGGQKNDREIINYEVSDVVSSEVEEAISVDTDEEAGTEQPEGTKQNKVESAVQATIDGINASVKKKKAPEAVEAPYDEFKLAIENNSDAPKRLESLRKEVNAHKLLSDDEKFELDTVIVNKLKGENEK